MTKQEAIHELSTIFGFGFYNEKVEVRNMTIKAMSKEHALQIFADLEAQGYEHVASYLYMQEWRKPGEKDGVIVGKFYGYNRKPGTF